MELLPQCLHTFNLSHPELMEAGVEIFSLYWQPLFTAARKAHHRRD
jgi:hypothetical protein